MTDNYEKIASDNLKQFYRDLTDEKIRRLPATRLNDAILFNAFGEDCRITPAAITLGGEKTSGVIALLISLYALHAKPEAVILEPMRAFRELPDSAPYTGAFTTHAEKILIPHLAPIRQSRGNIINLLHGRDAPPDLAGDFSFLVFPLPKIALCYIFYEADEDFPASAKCLYSNNAHRFLPTDALADVGEVTSKTIISIANS